MSSLNEGSEGVEKFLRDKLVSLSVEGLERIVQVGTTVVLELLDEMFLDRGSAGSNMVPVDEELLKGRVDYFIRSELKETRISSVSKRPLFDVDADNVCVGSLLQSVLLFNLPMKVVDSLLQDVNWLVCQMPVSRSQIAPHRIILIMVHPKKNRLHGGELTM